MPTAALVGEILSPNDETWEMLSFSASHGVDQVLIVDYFRRVMRLYVLTSDHTEATRSAVLNHSLSSISAISWPGQQPC